MKRFILISVLFSFTLSLFTQDKIIRMGYRTTEKLPYIEAEPNNDGLFIELFSEAATRIGYKLEIVRKPKIRVLEGIKTGKIDFYPLYAYNQERAEYSYWIKSGIEQADIAISRDDVPSLTSINQINGLKYLVALGNPDYLTNKDKSSLNIVTIPELSVERALELIKLNRADIYIYERETLQYFIKSNNLTGYKFQPGFYLNPYLSYTGVSRKSKHFSGVKNTNYDPAKGKSIDNFPFIIDKECTFAKFEKALLELEKEGFTQELFRKYFQ